MAESGEGDRPAEAAPEGEEEPRDGGRGDADGDAASAAKEEPVAKEDVAMEREEDAKEDGRPGLTTPPSFGREDSTFNVLPTAGGRLLMGLSEHGLKQLLAGARASVGLKAGVHMFEVVPMQVYGGVSGRSQPRVMRVGVSLAEAPLLLSEDNPHSVSFDSGGAFLRPGSRERVSGSFGTDRVLAVVVNLDPSSPNANTVSLFINGRRSSEPQKLPEELVGKPLFPAVTYRGVALKVHFGPAPLMPLPFNCRMLQQAAAEDCELPATPSPQADGRQEVIFPVGLPDEGTFRWVDYFLGKNRNFTELSGRAILEWGEGSGLRRKGSIGCNDKPALNFGVEALDDLSLPAWIAGLSTAVPRNFIVAEVQGNLLAAARREALARFSSARFRKIAVVVMGEPPEEYKSHVQACILEAKRREASKASKDRKEDVGQQAAELTEEEKQAWFHPTSMPDLKPTELARVFPSFSLPEASEGFDEIRFEWQPPEESHKYFKQWLLKQKTLQRVEDISPSTWFTNTLTDWMKSVRDWKEKQKGWKQILEQLSEWKKEGGEKKDEEEKKGADKPTDIDPEELEVFQVPDINDIGSGEPLFAAFGPEDWELLERRFELHLLVYAFRRDVKDPERPMFHQSHLNFYYRRYFRRELNLNMFSCTSNKEFIDLLKDTVVIKAGEGMLVPVLSETTPMDNFVRLTEEHRRDRQRRLDAGDETAALNFKRHAPAMAAHATRPEAAEERPPPEIRSHPRQPGRVEPRGQESRDHAPRATFSGSSGGAAGGGGAGSQGQKRPYMSSTGGQSSSRVEPYGGGSSKYPRTAPPATSRGAPRR